MDDGTKKYNNNNKYNTKSAETTPKKYYTFNNLFIIHK